MQNIKYDPEQWVDVAANKATPCPKQAHVRLAAPGTLSFKHGSNWRLIGYGSEFKLSLPDAGQLKADQPLAIFVGIDTVAAQMGVPLTNFDKRPGMSSIERMIKEQFRAATLRQKLRDEVRRKEDRELNEKRMAEGKQDENPVPPEPITPTPEPTTPETPPEPSQPVTDPAETASN